MSANDENDENEVKEDGEDTLLSLLSLHHIGPMSSLLPVSHASRGDSSEETNATDEDGEDNEENEDGDDVEVDPDDLQVIQGVLYALQRRESRAAGGNPLRPLFRLPVHTVLQYQHQSLQRGRFNGTASVFLPSHLLSYVGFSLSPTDYREFLEQYSQHELFWTPERHTSVSVRTATSSGSIVGKVLETSLRVHNYTMFEALLQSPTLPLDLLHVPFKVQDVHSGLQKQLLTPLEFLVYHHQLPVAFQLFQVLLNTLTKHERKLSTLCTHCSVPPISLLFRTPIFGSYPAFDPCTILSSWLDILITCGCPVFPSRVQDPHQLPLVAWVAWAEYVPEKQARAVVQRLCSLTQSSNSFPLKHPFMSRTLNLPPFQVSPPLSTGTNSSETRASPTESVRRGPHIMQMVGRARRLGSSERNGVEVSIRSIFQHLRNQGRSGTAHLVEDGDGDEEVKEESSLPREEKEEESLEGGSPWDVVRHRNGEDREAWLRCLCGSSRSDDTKTHVYIAASYGMWKHAFRSLEQLLAVVVGDGDRASRKQQQRVCVDIVKACAHMMERKNDRASSRILRLYKYAASVLDPHELEIVLLDEWTRLRGQTQRMSILYDMASQQGEGIHNQWNREVDKLLLETQVCSAPGGLSSGMNPISHIRGDQSVARVMSTPVPVSTPTQRSPYPSVPHVAVGQDWKDWKRLIHEKVIEPHMEGHAADPHYLREFLYLRRFDEAWNEPWVNTGYPLLHYLCRRVHQPGMADLIQAFLLNHQGSVDVTAFDQSGRCPIQLILLQLKNCPAALSVLITLLEHGGRGDVEILIESERLSILGAVLSQCVVDSILTFLQHPVAQKLQVLTSNQVHPSIMQALDKMFPSLALDVLQSPSCHTSMHPAGFTVTNRSYRATNASQMHGFHQLMLILDHLVSLISSTIEKEGQSNSSNHARNDEDNEDEEDEEDDEVQHKEDDSLDYNEEDDGDDEDDEDDGHETEWEPDEYEGDSEDYDDDSEGEKTEEEGEAETEEEKTEEEEVFQSHVQEPSYFDISLRQALFPLHHLFIRKMCNESGMGLHLRYHGSLGYFAHRLLSWSGSSMYPSMLSSDADNLLIYFLGKDKSNAALRVVTELGYDPAYVPDLPDSKKHSALSWLTSHPGDTAKDVFECFFTYALRYQGSRLKHHLLTVSQKVKSCLQRLWLSANNILSFQHLLNMSLPPDLQNLLTSMDGTESAPPLLHLHRGRFESGLNSLQCSMCFSPKAGYVFMPCSHMYCGTCGLGQQACPLCKEEVKQIVNISGLAQLEAEMLTASRRQRRRKERRGKGAEKRKKVEEDNDCECVKDKSESERERESEDLQEEGSGEEDFLSFLEQTIIPENEEED